MVSVAVSKLGKTDLVFVQPGAKINSVYYCHNVLEQGFAVHRMIISFFSRTERRHTVHGVHATLSLTCAPMKPNSLNRKTSRQTVQI